MIPVGTDNITKHKAAHTKIACKQLVGNNINAINGALLVTSGYVTVIYVPTTAHLWSNKNMSRGYIIDKRLGMI